MKYIAILTVILLFAVSCNKVPSFSDTPIIRFKSVNYTPRTNLDGNDRLSVVVSFQDGNGDLGLNANEQDPPFNYLNPDSSINPNFFNFFITILVQQTDGSFEPYQFPVGFESISLNGRFLRLKDEERPAPLEGEINYTKDLAFADLPNLSNQTVKLSIFIQDRALNRSNTVESDTFVIR
jgi:hypothetical protein